MAKYKSASGGLKQSPPGVNAQEGAHYVVILEGTLYVDRTQVKEFKRALKELCERFDYKFVPEDAQWSPEQQCPECGTCSRTIIPPQQQS